MDPVEENKIHPAVQEANRQLEIMWNSGRKLASKFENDNIRFTEVLLVSSGLRGLLVWIYCLLRNYKKITALEDLPQEEKEHMWAFTKEICIGEHATVKKRKEICMCFYAIEYFLNETK